MISNIIYVFTERPIIINKKNKKMRVRINPCNVYSKLIIKIIKIEILIELFSLYSAF